MGGHWCVSGGAPPASGCTSFIGASLRQFGLLKCGEFHAGSMAGFVLVHLSLFYAVTVLYLDVFMYRADNY